MLSACEVKRAELNSTLQAMGKGLAVAHANIRHSAEETHTALIKAHSAVHNSLVVTCKAVNHSAVVTQSAVEHGFKETCQAVERGVAGTQAAVNAVSGTVNSVGETLAAKRE